MKLNILIVDDSIIVFDVFQKTFNLLHLPIEHIYFAQNGKEALNLLHMNWIDMVFADLHMPEMGGIELIEQMAQEDLLRDIPVVVVSAEGNRNTINRLKNTGIRAYIRKPFTPEEVHHVLGDILGVHYEKRSC